MKKNKESILRNEVLTMSEKDTAIGKM